MIKLKKMGSFHVGGYEIEVRDAPIEYREFTPGAKPLEVNPNGYHHVNQIYIQYYIPYKIKSVYPLVLIHGGGMTGVAYETTPDNREGWLNFFIKEGWAVYNTDGVGRGRSGWNGYAAASKKDPVFLPKHDPFERFRIGKGRGSYCKNDIRKDLLPGNQFPVNHYNQFMKQVVPRWIGNEEVTLSAYIELLKKTGPTVLLAHSQGCLFAMKLAESYPDLVKGVILIEPTINQNFNNSRSLDSTPILILYGDYITKDNRWFEHKKNTQNSLKDIELNNKNIETILLPELNIYGNSHLPMMDKNSDEIAEVIQEWLVSKKFMT